MVDCKKCKKPLVVDSEKGYVYIFLSVGKPSEEKYFFFHQDCFISVLKMKTELCNELEQRIIEQVMFH